MKHLSGLFLLVMIFPVSMLYAEDNPLQAFRAEYVVEHDGEIVARTRLSLQKNVNNHWKYRSRSHPTGWLASMMGLEVSEESTWTWDNGIKIKEYRYDRAGKEKHVNLEFNWQDKIVTNVINGDPWQMEIPEGTLDKLSINLALAAHLMSSETDVSFPVADGGKLKTYDFKVLGKETLETDIGRLNTIKVSRNKRGRKDKQATIWLAPSKNHLVVKMEKADKDDEVVTVRILSSR